MNFRFLSGDVNWNVYGGAFISKKLIMDAEDEIKVEGASALPYWMVIEVNPKEEEEEAFKYNVLLMVYSPQAVGEEKLRKAYAQMGLEQSYDEWIGMMETQRDRDWANVDILHRAGMGTVVWNGWSDNLHNLLAAAHRAASQRAARIEDRLDSEVNGVGMTGWHFLQSTTPQEFFGRKLS